MVPINIMKGNNGIPKNLLVFKYDYDVHTSNVYYRKINFTNVREHMIFN